MHVGVKVQLQSFLTSAIDGGEMSDRFEFNLSNIFYTEPSYIQFNDSHYMEPPFNIPQFNVLPHLTFSFSEHKSVMFVLNHLHLKFSSV
jgi:hypothetical protein